MRLAVLTVLFMLALAVPAWAGFDEGMAAYERGDYATALKEWRPLAEQSNAGAQNYLGFLYDLGKGVPQDYAEAAKWYSEAAEQGNAGAQFNLGTMYAEGRGVPKDYLMAHMWFNLAAAKFPVGDAQEEAAKNRNSLEAAMTPADVSKAQRLAREWLEKRRKSE